MWDCLRPASRTADETEEYSDWLKLRSSFWMAGPDSPGGEPGPRVGRPPRPTHGCTLANSCEIHRFGSNTFILIDWFPYKICSSVKSLQLLHVGSIPGVLQPAVTRRPMMRHTIGPASSGLGEGLAGQDVLVPSRSSNSCGGTAACTLTWSPVVQCFLQHISAAGFRVKQAVCQEAVRLGGVMFRGMHGPRPSYGSCDDRTRL